MQNNIPLRGVAIASSDQLQNDLLAMFFASDKFERLMDDILEGDEEEGDKMSGDRWDGCG